MLFPKNPVPPVRNIEVEFIIARFAVILFVMYVSTLARKIKSHDDRILQKNIPRDHGSASPSIKAKKEVFE